MNDPEMIFDIDADGIVQNSSDIIQTEKPDSAEPKAENEYFLFDLNYCGKSYSVRAKNRDMIPSILTIPGTHNGLPVTLISENGFSHCTELSVLLFEEPSHIQTIACGAFAACKNIESVTLPESIVCLDSCAFSGCSLLQQVYFRSKCPPCLEQCVFEESSPFLNLYVPAYSYCHYSEAQCWWEYRDLILPSPEHVPSSLGYFRFEQNEQGDSYAIYAKNWRVVPLTLSIPERYNRKPVTIIGQYAFGNSIIRELMIPNTIEEIGNSAFVASTSRSIPGYIHSYSQLERVVFGKKSSLLRIGASAFLGNLKLTSIKLPETVRVLDVGAFMSCGFRLVVIPQYVEEIGRVIFAMCLQLERISVDKRNAFFRDVDGILYNSSLTTMLAYPLGRKATVYSLPETVTRFGNMNEAFWGCQNLMALRLPSLTPPDMQVNLYGVFPESVLKIYVPDESYDAYVNAAGWSQYAYMIHKKSVINNGFAMVGNELLQYVGDTSELTIPKEVQRMADFALATCKSLKRIAVEEGNPSFLALDGVLFTRDLTRIVWYPPSRPESEYEIPQTVQSVGTAAFFSCGLLSLLKVHKQLEIIGDYACFQCVSLSGLMNLDAQDNIKSIGIQAFLRCVSIQKVRFMALEAFRQGAFHFCTGLTNITFGPSLKEYRGIMISAAYYYTPPHIDMEIFALTPPHSTNLDIGQVRAIYVPADSIEMYKTTAPWSNYSSRIFPLTIALIR